MGNAQRSEWFHAEHEATDRVSCPNCSKAFVRFEYSIDTQEECASCRRYFTSHGTREIFMCPDHKDRAYCSTCHDIRSEMEIYGRLTSKIKRIPTKTERDQLVEQSETSLDEMTNGAVENINLIGSNCLNHQRLSTDVCKIIVSYFNTHSYDTIKVAKHPDLVNVFGKIWDLLCFDSQPRVIGENGALV